MLGLPFFFRSLQQRSEHALRSRLPFHGRQRHASDHRPYHRNGDFPAPVADLDRPIGLLDQDRLHPLFFDGRELIFCFLRTTARVARFSLLETRCCGRLAVTHLIAGRSLVAVS